MKFKLFIIFILSGVMLYAQHSESNTYKKEAFFFTPTSDSLKIETIINLYKEGKFTKEKKPHLYKKLSNKTLWIHIPLNSKDSVNALKEYLTLTFPYLHFGKVYVKNKYAIKTLQKNSYDDGNYNQVFYRYPVWKIPKDFAYNSDLFLELRNNGGRTKLELLLETENQFLKKIESDYIGLGSYIAFLVSMTLFLLFYSILKKEYSVILYALYIASMLVEFLAGKGIGAQFLWSDSPFFIHNIRTLTQTIATLSLGFFYTNFYKFKKQQFFSKLTFKWSSLITIPLLGIYLYKYFFGGLESFYLLVWVILKIIIVIYFINHIYLTLKKQLPNYLIFAFSLPIISTLVVQEINPLASSSKILLFCVENIYYLAIAIEICVFTWYILSTVIDNQRNYYKLKKINTDLKVNFQKSLYQTQEKERHKLLGDIHDSFGGYLEALKLRLLQNKFVDNANKVEEILNSFYIEYRYLLNNLFSPKINSNNFTEHFVDYCKKMDALSHINIFYNFDIPEINLSQNICLNLYRIISESLTNAIKHSQASQINISLTQNANKTLKLLIVDNGIGFDLKKESKNHYGLDNIKKRVDTFKGTIEINSDRTIGTSIIIIIPNDTK